MWNDLTREEEDNGQQHMSTTQCWSSLCPDVLRQILENSSLSTIDFNQAKTVCSNWYSVWKTCVKPARYPWQIMFKSDGSSILFDPKEGKSYDTKLLKLDFSEDSFCMTTSGNWLLMVDSRLEFYLINVLTGKRINLPPMESSIRGGQARFHRTGRGCGYFTEPTRKEFVSKEVILRCSSSADSVLSVNEKTEDYFVALVFEKHFLFTHKKGDDSWRNLNTEGTDLSVSDLAYKNNKLYMLTLDGDFKVFDISRDFSKEENPYKDHPFRYICRPSESIWKTKKIAIRNSGEVLVILSIQVRDGQDMFYVFKMNVESLKWERVKSIGDDGEMLIFGHGVTVRAPVKEVGCGIKSDSICFIEGDISPYFNSSCGIFDLATSKIKTFEELGVISSNRWLVLGFD